MRCARASPRARSGRAGPRASWWRGWRCSSTSSRRAFATCTRTAPIEVALQVEPALERAGDREATRAWCARVLEMYRAWAANRHMQLSEIAGAAPGSLPLLVISGFGAHRQLVQEAGLHVLEADDGKGRGRATARVRLAVAPLGDLPADKLRLALIDALQSRCAAARGRAALSQRSVAAGAQHERQLAQRPARCRAGRRLRPDRGAGGGGGLEVDLHPGCRSASKSDPPSARARAKPPGATLRCTPPTLACSITT